MAMWRRTSPSSRLEQEQREWLSPALFPLRQSFHDNFNDPLVNHLMLQWPTIHRLHIPLLKQHCPLPVFDQIDLYPALSVSTLKPQHVPAVLVVVDTWVRSTTGFYVLFGCPTIPLSLKLYEQVMYLFTNLTSKPIRACFPSLFVGETTSETEVGCFSASLHLFFVMLREMEIVSLLPASTSCDKKNAFRSCGAELMESITFTGGKFLAGSAASSRRLSPRITICVQ